MGSSGGLGVELACLADRPGLAGFFLVIALQRPRAGIRDGLQCLLELAVPCLRLCSKRCSLKAAAPDLPCLAFNVPAWSFCSRPSIGSFFCSGRVRRRGQPQAMRLSRSPTAVVKWKCPNQTPEPERRRSDRKTERPQVVVGGARLMGHRSAWRSSSLRAPGTKSQLALRRGEAPVASGGGRCTWKRPVPGCLAGLAGSCLPTPGADRRLSAVVVVVSPPPLCVASRRRLGALLQTSRAGSFG